MQLSQRKLFFFSKRIRYVFNENTDQFYVFKNLDLYLMKIQIGFMGLKIRSAFNENAN